MSILTYIVDAEIKDAKEEYDGKTLTSPTLIMSDGVNQTYAVDVDIGERLPLRDVPLATTGRDIIYAAIGSPVRVRRSASGKFEVTGFSKRMPGTYHVIEVTIPSFLISPVTVFTGAMANTEPPTIIVGTPFVVGVATRVLTYGELAAMGLYGIAPYGSYAYYENGQLTGVYP